MENSVLKNTRIFLIIKIYLLFFISKNGKFQLCPRRISEPDGKILREHSGALEHVKYTREE